MKRIYFLVTVLIISLLTISCRKDIDNEEATPPYIPPVVKVLSSIHGNVTDDQGSLVSGALVTFENESVLTDKNGVFQFSEKRFNKNGTYISVEKEGYFKGSRRFYPITGTTSIVNVELITLDIIGDFNSEEVNTISHQGIVLDFPKDAIVKEDGTNYNGQVNVAMAYLDPTDNNTLDQMPGDLTGVSTNEQLVALKSLGMITVELLDDNGNELNIKNGQMVGAKIPIPASLQDNAPSSIPMWHFDEVDGIWKEEGFAELVGNNYETSLAHFSFWNCDIPIDYVFLKGTILNRGIPILGITVMIEDLNNNTSGYGVTDENGMFCGYIPGGEELVLTVYDQCGEVIYTTTIGPFAEDVILDPINLNLLVDYASISGSTTVCDGELSENAYVIVQAGTENYSFPIQDDGTFLGDIFYCAGNDEVMISAFDPLNGLSSGDYVFEIEGQIEVGNIELCDIAFVEHIIIEYGNVKWDIPLDADNLFILFHIHPDVNTLTGADEEGTTGYIIKPTLDYQGESPKGFGFIFNFIEGEPFQDVNVTVGPGGFRGHGPGLVQLVSQDGVEYIKVSGTVPFSSLLGYGMYDESYTEIYFDIFLENK